MLQYLFLYLIKYTIFCIPTIIHKSTFKYYMYHTIYLLLAINCELPLKCMFKALRKSTFYCQKQPHCYALPCLIQAMAFWLITKKFSLLLTWGLSDTFYSILFCFQPLLSRHIVDGHCIYFLLLDEIELNSSVSIVPLH